MTKIRMLGYQIKEYSFKNALTNGEKIAIEAKYSYNVKYSEAGRCIGEMTAYVNDRESPDKFSIKVVGAGVFAFEPGSEKPRVHVETFKALFPTVKTYIAMVTAASGIPALMVPEIDIESREIYSFEMPKPRTRPDDDPDSKSGA